MINWINEFMYFDNKKVPNVDNVKSSSNSTIDPMYKPEDGKQIKNSALQNKTQQGYRKFPYSLLPLAVTSSNAVSYMEDEKGVINNKWGSDMNKVIDDLNELNTLDEKITKSDIDKFNKSKNFDKWLSKEQFQKSFMKWWNGEDIKESSKNKFKFIIEDIIDNKLSKDVLNNIDKTKLISQNGIPDIDVISEENPLLVRKVTNLIDIIKKNQATGEQKGIILNFLINNIDIIDIPETYKKELLKKIR